MKLSAYIVGIIAVLLLAYGIWSVGKWINYKLAYKSGVESTIRDMVKPECLKDTQP